MANENVESMGIASLSAAQRKTLQALKRPITETAKSLGIIREKMKDLAPKVMKLYDSIVSDHGSRFTFVDFARLFDPSIPTHAADRNGVTGYRNHRVYYTLANLRRMVQLQGRPRQTRQGVRDTATDDLARTLATILQVVAEPENVWTQIQTEFGYSERVMTRLRKRVEATRPIFKLDIKRPVHATVIHMDSVKPAPAETTAEALPARGRRITVEERGAAHAKAS